jgi:hypothetical protein
MADSSLASGPITTGVGSTTVLGNGVSPVFTRIDTSNSMHNASNSHLNLDKSVDANDDVSTQATRRAASKASRVCLSVTPESETAQISQRLSRKSPRVLINTLPDELVLSIFEFVSTYCEYRVTTRIHSACGTAQRPLWMNI